MSEVKTEETVEYEQELKYRLKILKEDFEAGKINIAEGLSVNDSLNSVRYDKNGEIDLETVDGVVRSMAMMSAVIRNREDLKNSISLSEIQHTYFEFVERNFGAFYKIMQERKMSPHDAGMIASKCPSTIKELLTNVNEFLDAINEFWMQTGDIAQIHIEDMHSNVKGVFGGDLFPSHSENIASKCGIYTDTIILPDPFLRSKHIFENFSNEKKAYYFMKHAMNILQYKDLACADVEIPIIAIIPDFSALEEEEKEFYHKLGIQDSLIHSQKLFGRKFESFDELMEFTQHLDTVEKAIAEVNDPSKILFDTSWKGDAKEQLKQALDSNYFGMHQFNSPGLMLAMQAVGRMGTSNELLIKARRLNGTPIIDAPTSWKYFSWKIEYDAERMEKETNSHDLHVLNGLQGLGTNQMEWIGNIPVEALIEIRKEGALDEIRSLLGKGINDLIDSNPSNFHRTRDQIFDNINSAFKDHEENLKLLKSKQWKFAGTDIGSWMVMGTLEVAAAITGTPVWGMGALAVNQVVDAPKLKDIPSSIKKLVEENKKVKKSPVGLLFNIRKKNA